MGKTVPEVLRFLRLETFATISISRNERDKMSDRGPYRKELDRLRARYWPIKFKDLGFQLAEMFRKK